MTNKRATPATSHAIVLVGSRREDWMLDGQSEAFVVRGRRRVFAAE